MSASGILGALSRLVMYDLVTVEGEEAMLSFSHYKSRFVKWTWGKESFMIPVSRIKEIQTKED